VADGDVAEAEDVVGGVGGHGESLHLSRVVKGGTGGGTSQNDSIPVVAFAAAEAVARPLLALSVPMLSQVGAAKCIGRYPGQLLTVHQQPVLAGQGNRPQTRRAAPASPPLDDFARVQDMPIAHVPASYADRRPCIETDSRQPLTADFIANCLRFL
jgi:hypothetical protein